MDVVTIASAWEDIAAHGENPAGTSVSVKIPHDALVVIHAIGDAMLPQNQNPPTALCIRQAAPQTLAVPS
jgi:hypothetical protein